VVLLYLESSQDGMVQHDAVEDGFEAALEEDAEASGSDGEPTRLKKVYCDVCALPVGSHVPPVVRLPVKLEIWRHPAEKSGKSTTNHAKLTSPDDTEIKIANFYQDGIPECLSSLSQEEISRTLLLYPSEDAVGLEEIPRGSFDKLIVIDDHGEAYLATIEAIYYFFKTFSAVYEDEESDRERFEPLLFYFREQYQLIQDHYRSNTTRKFTSRKQGEYIKYS
ncbi:MAG: hypothetical protein SGCHY_000852, partial [Lobulomycetales sp.]